MASSLRQEPSGSPGGPTVTRPSGVSKARLPSASQPRKRCRVRMRTRDASSRPSHARRSGEALKLFGNTRPLDPTKVGWPSPSHQSRKACGGNASTAFREGRIRRVVAAVERLQRLAMREVEAAPPGDEELAPHRGHPPRRSRHGDRPRPESRRPPARPGLRRSPRCLVTSILSWTLGGRGRAPAVKGGGQFGWLSLPRRRPGRR